MVPARLILASGEEFQGVCPDWQSDVVLGEVVFNTGMVGYTEALTDPSYKGQILTFTYPLIGNYGVADASTYESEKAQAAGMIVAELADHYSNYKATTSLLDWCKQQGLPLIANIDTRALTKTLRSHGVVAGAISKGDSGINEFPDINQSHLVEQVSQFEPSYSGEGDKTIILVDCGVKGSILRCLEKFPLRVKRVPYNYDFTKEDYDGVLISNGPGDPTLCQETVAIVKRAMQTDKPIFGICLGSQIMGLALGAETFKLQFGHRGQNHPCLEKDSKRCYLTSQNHGFAVKEDSLPADWSVWFRNLNDNTVQGIAHNSKPQFAVQFHPEAGPGPVDTFWIFEKFYKLVANK